MSRTKKKKEAVETKDESVVDTNVEETSVVEDEVAPLEEAVEQLKNEDKASEEVETLEALTGVKSGETIQVSDEEFEKLSTAVKPKVKEKESFDFTTDIEKVVAASSLSTRKDFELDKELNSIFTKLSENGLGNYTAYDALVELLICRTKEQFTKEFEIDPELARKLKEDLVK